MAGEAGALAKELVASLRKRLLERKDEAAECIQLLRQLGEPVEALQEDFLECRSSPPPFSLSPIYRCRHIYNMISCIVFFEPRSSGAACYLQNCPLWICHCSGHAPPSHYRSGRHCYNMGWSYYNQASTCTP